MQILNAPSFFRKLKILGLQSFHNEQAVNFRYGLLQRIPTLECLQVLECSFKEIFSCGRQVTIQEQHATGTAIVHLKRLLLRGLPYLENICKKGSQLDPLLEKLEILKVCECSRLIKLVPSTVSFKHLTFIEVQNCNKLVNLLAPSTAKSLVQLRTLRIVECKMIEEIIANDQEEEAEDEIEFMQLQVLELVFLLKLTSFCSRHWVFKFPLLTKVNVKGCPRMEAFSKGVSRTPKLHKVQVEGTKEWYWERNLNATIDKLFHGKVALQSVEKLELSQLPKLQEIWHGQFPNRSFSKLRELIVEKCDFVSKVISMKLLRLLNNLVELKVGSCDLLEAVFDFEGTDDIEDHGQNRAGTHLRKLTLSHLPRLKHLWNKDPKGLFSFENLQEIHVLNCGVLIYLFPASVAKGLERLQELKIDSCAQMKEMVAMEEGIPESTIIINFVFPRVISVFLKDLPELEHFYPGPHTIEWPKLKWIYTIFCGKLEIFTIDSINFHETDPEDDQQVAIIQQPLFSIEKVLPNIEALSLDGKDAMRICNGQYVVDDLFCNLTFLRLQSFDDEQAASNFSYWFIQKIPHLKGLVVKYSSFQEIFPCQRHEAGETQTMTVVQLIRCMHA
ncbi:NBS-LRR type disease resistance protein [Quillaja saponaria]|uniref:NBS-LRR type disease resistance protein n=1 Tax=Quillaja saponaria TaxID=32244 RepID=A0AAD7KNQ6_QUISA|nr:NBS-LRR type disease resistance protein [Quillaja saponaria]